MKLEKISTKELLECVKCGRHFKHRDMVEEKRMLYNVESIIRKCPYCGTHEVEPVREQIKMEKYKFLPKEEKGIARNIYW